MVLVVYWKFSELGGLSGPKIEIGPLDAFKTNSPIPSKHLIMIC